MIDGRAAAPTALETALVGLARRSWEAPARLAPADLAPLHALVGDGALDYVMVVGGFHFINRIADLLHVDPEALPAPLRRIEPLRRLAVRAAGALMARMDLANRPYRASFDEVVAAVAPTLAGAGLADARAALAPLRARPKAVEILRLAIEERDRRSTLDRPTLARIHRTVEAALPAARADAEGFHARPADPVEALAFVGTRYAARTTAAMIASLRTAGWDDLGILDLATAIADANQWARTHRLLGLTPEIFYVREDGRGTSAAGA